MGRPRSLEYTVLTGATLTDRLHVGTLLVRRAARGLRRLIAWPISLQIRVPHADRLLIAPQDIRTTDPTTAADIGSGYFAFGGKIVNAVGRSPFAAEPGSDPWLRQLAGFGWLRHLRLADSAGVRARGRDIVDDFLHAYPTPTPHPVWAPRVAARRILSWLSQSPIILDGVDRDFYVRFMQALSRHCTYLERQIAGGLSGSDRLLVAVALAEYGLCVDADPARQRRSTDALAAEIVAQVLPDGCHISRNPQVLIDLLLDLLPLRQAYAARGIQAPAEVLNAIDRMMPMLRLFRHGDGTLALFNGMGVTAPELVATVLAYDDARAQALTNARMSGYQRLERDGTLVIVDAGTPPEGPFSIRAHAGCLAFELSSGWRRLVINCGGVDSLRPSARQAARRTAAHSTLVIHDTSSCRFARNSGLQRWLHDQILDGPTKVGADRAQDASGDTLTLSHDGYARRFGLIHRRSLRLFADGNQVDGHDSLAPIGRRKSPPVDFTLRFHLHPSLKTRVDADGFVVTLDSPDGERWRFEASAECRVTPSILFAAAGGPRPTQQIEINTSTAATREVHWSFRRIAYSDAPTRSRGS